TNFARPSCQCRCARLPVVPTGLGEIVSDLVLAVPGVLGDFWAAANCRHPTSVHRMPKDYVTGREQKPLRMSCNTARLGGVDEKRCGTQARFWEARRYPSWLWTAGSMMVGALTVVAYIAFVRVAIP